MTDQEKTVRNVTVEILSLFSREHIDAHTVPDIIALVTSQTVRFLEQSAGNSLKREDVERFVVAGVLNSMVAIMPTTKDFISEPGGKLLDMRSKMGNALN